MAHAAALDTHLRDGLDAALNLADVPLNDRVVSLAVLELISNATSVSPVLLMMDDFHLHDQPSQEALSFVARRMVTEQALMIFTIRPHEIADDSMFATIERLQLSGLDAESSRCLVEATGRTYSDDLFTLCRGNPLALEHLAKQSPRDGEFLLPDRIRQGFRRSISRYSAATQTALALIAVAGSVPRSVQETALQSLGVTADDLRQPEADGLLDAQYEFRHPLMRTAAQPQPADRLLIHDALAEASPNGSASAVLHRLKGSGPFPPELVSTAVSQAKARPSTGATPIAIAARRRQTATEMSGRCEYYRKAAQMDGFSGRYGPAIPWFERAIAAADNPVDRLRSMRSLVWCEMWTTSTAAQAAAKLHRAVHSVDPTAATVDDLAQAWGSLIALYITTDIFAAIAAIHESPPSIRADIDADTMMALTIANDPAALPFRLRTIDKMSNGTVLDPAAFDVSSAAYCELQLLEGHWTVGDRCAAAYVAEVRQAHLEVEFGPAIARWVVARTFLGDATTAYGLTLTALEREPNDGSVLGISAFVGAVVGAERAKEWATRARDRGIELELNAFTIDGSHRLGLVELASDNLDGAGEHLEESWRLLANHGYRHPGYAYARGDIAEVFARTGRLGPARQVISELETSPFDLPWAHGVAARARGILGEAGQFDRALALLEESPWEVARTRLCWARVTQDATQARLALDSFEAMGARPWAARARALCGDSSAEPVAHGAHPLDALSERERTVALAVARGLSNKEVGGELFISVKTVDAHLQQIYRKLDVRSRTQLAALCYTIR